MRRVLIILSIGLLIFLTSSVFAQITGSVTNINDDSTSKNECINQCPLGCPAPADRICASDGEKYCNSCVIECKGLTEMNNSYCEKVVIGQDQNAKVYCLESAYKYENGSCVFKDSTKCDAEAFYNGECGQDKTLYKSQAQKQKDNNPAKTTKINEKNRIKINANNSECPNNCSCSGSATKCWINGNREMTITAGNSGNIIIQTKEINASTKVTLYKAEDGRLYRVTKNNETKEVKVLPEQVKEKIKEKNQAIIENEKIELDDNGIYQVETQKKVKFFALFPTKEKVKWEVDSETGEIIKTKTVWWGFLAKDNKEQPLLGATCGTVSPNSRDQCCQDRGFEYYNSETAECLNK